MKSGFLFIGLLFFSNLTWAAATAPQTSSKDPSLIEIENQKPQKPSENDTDHDLIQATEIPYLPSRKSDFFFADTQAVDLYTGAIFNVNSTSSITYGMFGLNYMWYSQRLFHIETAFDISLNQEAHLRVMGRWNLNSTERFRTYFNAGLGLKILPQDNPGVILSWPRLFIQGGYGMLYNFTQSAALKVEAFAATDSSFNAFFALIAGPSFSF